MFTYSQTTWSNTIKRVARSPFSQVIGPYIVPEISVQCYSKKEHNNAVNNFPYVNVSFLVQ